MNRDDVLRRRTMGRTAAAAAMAVGVVCLAAGPAAAHVGITPSTTAAGAHAVLELSVPHGCDGSPTTEVTVQIPDEITSVTPTRNALWEVEKQVVALDPPVADAHGNQVTERVASVTYRAKAPLPEGYRDAFELSVQLPDGAGDTLAFPTIQTCERGESAWIEVAADGQDADELALPAPAFELTEAHGDHEASAPADTSDAAATTDEQREASAGGSDAMSVAALAIGAVGIALGGTALLRQRRQT